MTVPQPAEHTTTPGGSANLAGRSVARIGFGVMQLGFAKITPETGAAILRQAIDAGVNHLDTAQFYGPCNDLIRTALSPYSDDLVLVSKVGAEVTPDAGLVTAQRPTQLREQVEANLTALGAERLDVVNLRRADTGPGVVAEADQLVDLDSQLGALAELRDAGKIGGIGLSNVSADQIRQALPAGIACVQNAYSVLNRSDEPALELCREQRIAWVPFFPLGSALPGIPKVTDNPTVVSSAAELDVTPAQLGLSWLLAHDPGTLLIPGTASPGHLADNIAAGDLQLSDEIVARLDALGSNSQPLSSFRVTEADVADRLR
ncbi:MAG: aldo/keto reductase [Stackebrandtia sp.]